MPLSNLERALRLVALGFKVFPCRSWYSKEKGKHDKRPVLSTSWKDDATSDEATIRSWWTKHPDWLPSITCERLVVIDVDDDRGKELDINKLEKLLGPLPTTWHAETLNKGHHLFFWAKPGIDTATKIAYVEKLDILASDLRFCCVYSDPPEMKDGIAEATDALMEAARKETPEERQEKKRKKSLEKLAQRIASAPPGTGHKAAYGAGISAGLMKVMGVNSAEAAAVLKAAAASRGGDDHDRAIDDGVEKGEELADSDPFRRTARGGIKLCPYNYTVAVQVWSKQRLWWCDWREQAMLDIDTMVNDQHLSIIQLDIDALFGLSVPIDALCRAIDIVAMQDRRHPIKKYLEESHCNWDNKTRVLDIAPLALKTDPMDDLSPILLTRWLLSAVARIFSPGCKADAAIILVGKQYAGKSTFFSTLFGQDWTNPSPLPVHKPGDLLATLSSAWCHELAELATLSRHSVEDVKQFITNPVDTGRQAYMRKPVRKPRASVLCGTTNKAEFLIDETGNRRFWTIPVSDEVKIDLAWVKNNRDHIWGELVDLYKKGASWTFGAGEFEALAQRNEKFRAVPALVTRAREYLRVNHNKSLSLCDMAESLLDKKVPTWAEDRQLVEALKAERWTSKRKWEGSVQLRKWCPPENPQLFEENELDDDGNSSPWAKKKAPDRQEGDEDSLSDYALDFLP